MRRRRALGTRGGIQAHRHRSGVRQRGERRRGNPRSGVHRAEIFVTTKFFPRRRDPVVELEGSLVGSPVRLCFAWRWPSGRQAASAEAETLWRRGLGAWWGTAKGAANEARGESIPQP